MVNCFWSCVDLVLGNKIRETVVLSYFKRVFYVAHFGSFEVIDVFLLDLLIFIIRINHKNKAFIFKISQIFINLFDDFFVIVPSPNFKQTLFYFVVQPNLGVLILKQEKLLDFLLHKYFPSFYQVKNQSFPFLSQ
jgi:hypothetical protein